MQPMKESIPQGYKKGSFQQFTPEQLELFHGLFSQLGPDSYLSRLAGGDQSMFAEMEQPALRQFQQQQGNIGARFSGMGSGAQRSSGFQHAQNQAATEFSENLASQRQQLQRQALMDLFGLSNQLLGQRPYEQFLTKEQPSFGSQLFGSLGAPVGAGLGAIGGYYAGDPMLGAQIGGKIGSQFGQSFGGY